MVAILELDAILDLRIWTKLSFKCRSGISYTLVLNPSWILEMGQIKCLIVSAHSNKRKYGQT